MIKCEVIEEFNIKDFKKLKNVVRANKGQNKDGEMHIKDTFECDKEMADYLTGGNDYKMKLVKVIEVEPAKEETKEEKPKNELGNPVGTREVKNTSKKTTKKTK